MDFDKVPRLPIDIKQYTDYELYYNKPYLLNNYSQWNTNKYVNIQYKAQNVQKYLVKGSNHIININLISVRANLIQKVQPMPR